MIDSTRLFSAIKSRWDWRPIPNCPGRFVLSTGPTDITPAAITPTELAISEHIVPSARDPVSVAPFADGGLISYKKRDGRYVHTLNTREGFERKLQQLGIMLD